MSNTKPGSFEAAMAQLEDILSRLGEEGVSLDESIELYAKAAGLVQQCNETLRTAQVRVEEIGKQLAEGEDT